MNYAALIENRKTVREFSDKAVPAAVVEELENYYRRSVRRLDDTLDTRLLVFGSEAREALEGAAGYESVLVGAPMYLVLLSAPGAQAGENAGYIMEDLILKLTDMDLGSCWLTFTDSERIKTALGIDSALDVAAIAAFGYGVKAPKRLRINILSMSNVDVQARRRYFDPKRSVYDMVFMNRWGNTEGLDEHIGFYDDMLWEAFYAASLSPSYLNRQAYGFVIHGDYITLVRRPDALTTRLDGQLSLGVVLLHFSAVASRWAGTLNWEFGGAGNTLSLPDGYEAVASLRL